MTREFSKTFEVKSENSAIHLGSGLLEVLATPALVAFMENTAMELLQAEVANDQSQVGIEINIQHLAATAIGRKVKVTAHLVTQHKRIYTFNLEAFEGDKLIGKGAHKRALVNKEQFMQNLS